jgi:hypothetical protein
VVEAAAGRGGDLLGQGRLLLVEALPVGVDLDQAPAAPRRREADHQQGLEAQLLQEGGLVRLGCVLQQRHGARLALLDDLEREGVVGDQVLVTELQRILAARVLGERDQEVADDARDRASSRVQRFDQLPARGLEQAANGPLPVKCFGRPPD